MAEDVVCWSNQRTMNDKMGRKYAGLVMPKMIGPSRVSELSKKVRQGESAWTRRVSPQHHASGTPMRLAHEARLEGMAFRSGARVMDRRCPTGVQRGSLTC
jgi:hypothetical protein